MIIENVLRQSSRNKSARIIVGYSGGLDSTVLLHLLNNIAQTRPHLSLLALHIHHGMQSHADDWARHCTKQGLELGVNTRVMRVQVSQKAGQSTEQAARQARFAAFESVLGPGDILCLAHHRDDQAETLLYRLLRGSGTLGLGAMRVYNDLGWGEMLRPLLSFSRGELEAYAQHHKLSWINDPSNKNTRFDRNYLREEVLPRLEERWPALTANFARAAELNQEAADLLHEMARDDLQRVVSDNGKQLVRMKLREISPPRLRNMLRYWLQESGLSLPSRINLQRIQQELVQSNVAGSAVVQWPGAEVRVFKNELYCFPSLPSFKPRGPITWDVSLSLERLDMGEALGQLLTSKSQGEGLDCTIVEKAHAVGKLNIRWRTGGERCQPAGRPHSQKLKKLLQEYGLPPWLRGRLPLLYIGDELVAVPSLWVCKGFTAKENEMGYVTQWSFYRVE